MKKINIIAFDSGYIKSRTAIIRCKYNYFISSNYTYFLWILARLKDFAVTLGIGIFTTLFSAYFIARSFTSLYVSKNKQGKINYNDSNLTNIIITLI